MMNDLILTPINGEPRIRDLDLAERLGFERPRKIRDLIKANEAKLLTFGVCPAVGQTSGAQGGRPATEYYLNQKQAIFICMKSETDNAFDVQAEIVRVFDAHLNGNAPPMTQSEMLVIAAQQLVAIEREQRRQAELQAQLEQRQDATEQRLDQIETATDHFTIIGWWRYAKQNGSLSLPEAARMGKKATAFCSEHAIDMGDVPDPRFGRAHTYPKWVLDELFATDNQCALVAH